MRTPRAPAAGLRQSGSVQTPPPSALRARTGPWGCWAVAGLLPYWNESVVRSDTSAVTPGGPRNASSTARTASLRPGQQAAAWQQPTRPSSPRGEGPRRTLRTLEASSERVGGSVYKPRSETSSSNWLVVCVFHSVVDATPDAASGPVSCSPVGRLATNTGEALGRRRPEFYHVLKRKKENTYIPSLDKIRFPVKRWGKGGGIRERSAQLIPHWRKQGKSTASGCKY